MKKEKLTLVIWGFIIFFLGLIFALSFVHTTTSISRQNQEYLNYKLYSARELNHFRNDFNQSAEELIFFRVSTYPKTTKSQIFAFKKEDFQKYTEKLSLQSVNGDLFIVISKNSLEDKIKIKDQITDIEIPLIEYLKTGANYTGGNITTNFCPCFEFSSKAIYHLYDCKDWGCRLSIIK